MRISADFNHSTLGAVLSLSGDMAVVCAFFVSKSLCYRLKKENSINQSNNRL